MRKIKANDQVVVIAGKDKGKRGSVRSVNGERIVVSGVNVLKKHTKPNPQLGVAGGIVEIEAPVAISNVAVYNAKTSRADRVGFQVRDGKKVRIYKSTGELIDI